jgi:NAD(P)H-dependent flavin oxidoreductase YrpB (nitropropane dioxygenase family)
MPAARWPTNRLLDLLEIDVPIVQAPMAGAQGSALASAVSAAGGLGSLPCAMLNVEDARAEVVRLRAATNRGFQIVLPPHAAGPNPRRAAGASGSPTGAQVDPLLPAAPPSAAAVRRSVL